MENTKTNKYLTFEQLYLRYYSSLKRFARAYVVTEEDAENILQDVFLELWEKQESLFAYSNPIAFLFTAIKSRCINLLRRRTLEQEVSNRLQEEYARTLQINLESLQSVDEEMISKNNMEECIDKAINSLPPRCREIFLMSKIEGKKQKEIAEELHISIHAVETQMGIAYKKLREALKGVYPLFLFYICSTQVTKIHLTLCLLL